MSVHDVIESGKAWLEALGASEKAREAFRETSPISTRLYDQMQRAYEVEKEARFRHLSALKDLPSEGVPDDVRIDRLRTENERFKERIKVLRYEVTRARENNEERNRELDTLHYVWCDGGCKGGVHRYCGSPDDVTEEVVATAERWVARLRHWLVNRQAKRSRERSHESVVGESGKKS